MPDALANFKLFAKVNVENSQRISVLAASSLKESEFEADDSTERFLGSISYTVIPSIVRLCDTTSNPSKPPNQNPIQASAINPSASMLKKIDYFAVL